MTADKTLKCSHCTKEFKYDSERRRHEQSHSPQFQCKVCSKNFSFVSALRRHEKQHERIGSVTCNECGREFRDQFLLKRHTKYAHGGSYSCTKCDTVFNSEPALSTHMKTHKPETERRYQCSFEGCTKKFNFPHHLKHHEMTHTNNKQHFCKICGKGFIQSHHLKTHMKTHSADSSLHCTFPECNKKFATEYAKKRHVNKYHVKPDSGISSDSNSAYESTVQNNNESVAPMQYDDSISPFADMITKIEYEPPTSIFTENEELLAATPEDLSTTTTQYTEKEIDKLSLDVNSDGSNCKSVLGTCIMSEKGENCVCTEITKTDDEEYDFTPIGSIAVEDNATASNCKSSQCCGGRCGDNNNDEFRDEMPEIEYKTDGTVKIKEFLDVEMSLTEVGDVYDAKAKSDVKFVPYNSCKAVLGNCIVSGNGTMGDGCLCARMIVDEQVTAEEIEDITPHPW